MKPAEMIELLREFYADKVGLKRRHEAGVRQVGTYDFNNTYQYVINREEGHIDWLRRAIVALGGEAGDQANVPPVPSRGKGAELQGAIIDDDVALMQAFIDKWRARVEQVNDSRNKIMLRVVLGETMEHKRFFEQAAAGRHDLLGRRTSPSEASGSVLSTRWVE